MPKVNETGDKELFTFKLIAGKHVGWDLSVKPKQVVNKDTGETEDVYPPKTYRVGDTVVSTQDLGKIHGTTKFMPVQTSRKGVRGVQGADDEDFVPSGPSAQGVAFPGGQVIQGEQEATGDYQGKTVSGPAPGLVQTKSPSTPHSTESTKKGLDESRGRTDVGDDEDEDEEDDDDEAPGVKQSIEDKYGPLDSLTNVELDEIAKEEGVDLKGAGKKEDKIKKLKGAKTKAK